MDKLKNIYLYGISGVYNYGCEAMIRSISGQLKETYPDVSVIYKTYSLTKDSEALANCETIHLEAVVGKSNPIHKKGIRFLRRQLSIAKPEDYLYIDMDWTKQCDMLVIIGGDVFDMTPSQRTEKKYQNERIYVSQIVKRKGGKVILWGISVGNFDCNENAKKTLIDYFRDTVDFAVIRDEKSYDYLKKNGIKNIALCSDPAFIQRTIQINIKPRDKKILGINLSPLANKYLCIEKTETEWIGTWTELIIKAFKAVNYDEILLIPHVVNPTYKRDDDYQYLKEIYNGLKEQNIPVSLITSDVGFVSVKKHLVKCSMILAARMHCAVNSITCGVPTVFLSYSPKSVGMCKHVYGNTDWVLDMREMVNDFDEESIKQLVLKADGIRDFLKDRNIELFEDAKRATEYIFTSLS